MVRFFSILFTAVFFVFRRAQAQSDISQIIVDTADLIAGAVVRVSLLIAVAVFGWGIAKLVAAAGNTQKVQEAKGIIWWGVIALFVLGSISAIIYFIQTYIGTPGGGTVTPPQFTPL
jgi:ABC-type uncharacterized transport system fused permease/ATPase subunit